MDWGQGTTTGPSAYEAGFAAGREQANAEWEARIEAEIAQCEKWAKHHHEAAADPRGGAAYAEQSQAVEEAFEDMARRLRSLLNPEAGQAGKVEGGASAPAVPTNTGSGRDQGKDEKALFPQSAEALARELFEDARRMRAESSGSSEKYDNGYVDAMESAAGRVQTLGLTLDRRSPASSGEDEKAVSVERCQVCHDPHENLPFAWFDRPWQSAEGDWFVAAATCPHERTGIFLTREDVDFAPPASSGEDREAEQRGAERVFASLSPYFAAHPDFDRVLAEFDRKGWTKEGAADAPAPDTGGEPCYRCDGRGWFMQWSPLLGKDTRRDCPDCAEDGEAE